MRIASSVFQENPMRHLLITARELGQYHLGERSEKEAQRVLALLVEQGIPEVEACRRILHDARRRAAPTTASVQAPASEDSED